MVDNENWLADSQGPDKGGYMVIVVLGVIYFVLAAMFRFMAGYNPIPL